jgi:hypothetical protein
MKLIRHYPWTYSVLVIGVLVTVLGCARRSPPLVGGKQLAFPLVCRQARAHSLGTK